jgi:hypothetical protein
MHEVVIRRDFCSPDEQRNPGLSGRGSRIALRFIRAPDLRIATARPRDHDSFHLNYWLSVEKKPGS